MNQVLAINRVCTKIKRNLPSIDDPKAQYLLEEILNDLQVFLDKGIDFKEVVDSLDDSILITDADGKVLYINPAYENNTGILPEEILHRYIKNILDEGNLFTGGAIPDVIQTHKKVLRLSTVVKSSPPRVGYAIGVPVFDEQNQLKQIVVNSRPIVSLKALQEDYSRFLEEAKSFHETDTIKIISSSKEKTDGLKKRMIGSSQNVENIMKIINLVSDTDATVLITGESGVGKEVVADEIYLKSNRHNKPYVKVNCASIPSNLLESELFGYEKGAFSGASTNGKTGLFELANHGVILLDEIGDMPLDLQAKLLRVIQNREITKVGGTKPISLDIRIIASTNSNLREKIENGTFRSDLFYRLNVIPIHLDPLRAHIEDLEPLCDHFINIYSNKHKRSLSLSKNNLHIMKAYNWPGNIRELENIIEYLVICCSGSSEADNEVLKSILGFSTSSVSSKVFDLTESVSQFEKRQIEKVLSITNTLREAGELLNINASTISRKIKQYGIVYDKSR